MSWIDDFAEVELNAIERPDVPPGWTHTKSSYSRSEVDEWVKELQTVQNLSRTRGMRHEDFQRMRESQNPQERALGQTHHRFYDHARQGPQSNGGVVKLYWENGRFKTENGCHRVDRAQALGLRTIPARYLVREEDQAAAAPHVHRTGPLSPMDKERQVPARQPEPTGNERSATPVWERGGTPTRLRGERTRD